MNHYVNFDKPYIIIVSESMFWDKDKHKDGFPMQFKIFMAERFFWGLVKAVSLFIDVKEIKESKYGCFNELSVLRLNIIYLLNISLDLTTNLTPWYSLNNDAIKSTAASRYYPLFIIFFFKNSSNYFWTLNVT